MASSTLSQNPEASLAICRIQLRQSASPTAKLPSETTTSPADDENETLIDYPSPDLEHPDPQTRSNWSDSIAKTILNRESLKPDNGIRDWDLILNPDGTVENQSENKPSSLPPNRKYPARYRLPDVISERLDSVQKKVGRAERFALGCLLYQVQSGTLPMSELGDGEVDAIQSRFVSGEFMEDVWELAYVKRVLACWCPEFAREILAAHGENKTVLSKMETYVKQHPILFGLQVTGGLLSLASVVALPFLGVIGFGAAGPIAGSVAAGWQGSIGLVEAGSLFAWCQSAAMGGAAVTGIVATGLAGAGVAVGSVIMGGLDDIRTPAPELREKFLGAWKREIDGVEDGGKKSSL